MFKRPPPPPVNWSKVASEERKGRNNKNKQRFLDFKFRLAMTNLEHAKIMYGHALRLYRANPNFKSEVNRYKNFLIASSKRAKNATNNVGYSFVTDSKYKNIGHPIIMTGRTLHNKNNL
jgi:hypothetical protein